MSAVAHNRPPRAENEVDAGSPDATAPLTSINRMKVDNFEAKAGLAVQALTTASMISLTASSLFGSQSMNTPLSQLFMSYGKQSSSAAWMAV